MSLFIFYYFVKQQKKKFRFASMIFRDNNNEIMAHLCQIYFKWN